MRLSVQGSPLQRPIHVKRTDHLLIGPDRSHRHRGESGLSSYFAFFLVVPRVPVLRLVTWVVRVVLDGIVVAWITGTARRNPLLQEFDLQFQIFHVYAPSLIKWGALT